MRARRFRTRRFTITAAAALVTAVALTLAPGFGQPPTLSPLGIEVIGPQQWLVGSQAALRVIVTDYSQGTPVPRARVTIGLRVPGSEQWILLDQGHTDRHGTLRSSFEIPQLPPGAYQLVVTARYRNLADEATQNITLRRATQVLLTTDKPIYQPSQVIHLRALALQRPHLQAAADQEITLEVADPKGNKVFKQTSRTNAFGIASADFQLADEVNLGTYELRAIIGDDVAKKTVTVKRYVLPKFKVTITTDRGYYLPGERVEGTVQADYFFGKPVSGGKVTLTIKTFDVEFTQIAQIQGQTDDAGTYRFDCRLPDHFVGQPLEQGQAFLQFEAKVTDQADHSETAIHTSTVAASHVQIQAVPEAGALVPGLENLVYVVTSRPTGEPVEGVVRLVAVGPKGAAEGPLQREFATDALGIAEIPLRVASNPPLVAPQGPRRQRGIMGIMGGDQLVSDESLAQPVLLTLTVRLADGTTAQRVVELPTKEGQGDSLLLRVERPVVKVGDTINATALCSAAQGFVYFDVVKDRQTMLTHSGDLRDGKATADLVATPEISGTIYLSAYWITPRGQIIRDTRPIFVQPADDLTISVTPDRDTYLPGDQAQIAFRVADREGRPVAAALGINVVDESVFALQELQPGMEKVFFYLEQELMKPRYEIHGFELPRLVRGDDRPGSGWDAASRDRAARVVFAALEVPEVKLARVNTYEQRLAEARPQWAARMAPVVERIQQAIETYAQRHGDPPTLKEGIQALIKEGLLDPNQLKDLWGQNLVIEPASWGEHHMYFAVVISPGPDGRLDTIDDVIMSTMAPQETFSSREEAREPRWLFKMGAAMADGLVVRATAAPGEAAPEAVEGTMGPAGPEERPSVRVREYFPETLLVEPCLITDETGQATLTVPMADSITTWRLAAMANSALGQLGSTSQGLRCFQDFFADIDLPVSLTQGDQVSIPIAVYNYLPAPQTVRLELTRDDWFELSGEPTQELEIAANDVDVRYFTLTVKRIGNHPLTVHAYGSRMSDAIKRTVQVVPNGKQAEVTANGRLRGTVEETVTFPPEAIPDASRLLVKVYPGIFSQVVEGLDSILQMPFGCFEQTSAVTWPNVLVMDYMKTTGQITPEIQMKAEGFINTGYQRMLSYEVPGGGFSWFGDAPANKLLTAYGLMAFYDMSAVHHVDPAVIIRTQEWLLAQAGPNGAYQADEAYLHQETWGRLQVEDLLPTAYVVWSLTHIGCKDPRLERSAAYVRANWRKAKEPYTLAVVANALVGADTVLKGGQLDATTREALEALVAMAKTEGEQMWWTSEISGITHSTGVSADLEATGMAVLALMRGGLHPAEVSKVLNYLIASKDPRGTWHSTNATILALRALTLAQKGGTTRVNGEVTITVNGQQVSSFAVTPEDADVMRVVDCTGAMKGGANTVRLEFAGEGSTLYQVVGRYYLPWTQVERPAREALIISVTYDKTTLKQDDTVTATVTVRNNTPAATSMVLVDLGIPPGFTVDAGDFAELVGSGTINRYNITGRQVTVYFERLAPRQQVTFSYTLTARFPIRAQAPQSTAYEYYNPENRSVAKPVELEVTGG